MIILLYIFLKGIHMKPAIKTEYIHTINFSTMNYQAEHGLGGLDSLIENGSNRIINFSTKHIHQKSIHDSLKDIMPETIDKSSYKRLEQIFEEGKIEILDLRLVIQWLINKEVLPSGSYVVVF